MKALIALAAFLIVSGAARAEDKVVYHFDNSATQATKGLRNIKNHLEVDPRAMIVAVAHAEGVDFLMEGAKDAGGYPYALLVEDLAAQGVKFEVCEITLRNRKLSKEQFISSVTFVPSGVVEIAHLQAQRGFAYLKP
jgi:intracellular sulfur oxidation DsrE/DsrF family protein